MSRPRRSVTITASTALLVSALASLGGCAGPRNFVNENDRLRREVHELREQVESLDARCRELESKLAEAARSADLQTDPEVLEAIPRCAGIELGRLSGLVELDDQPGADAVRAYVEPYDGRRRFTQITGTLVLDAVFLPDPAGPAQGASPPPATDRTAISLRPRDLRDAYRSDLLGARYDVDVPLPQGHRPPAGDVVIRVVFTDALTGVVHRAERIIRSPSPSAPRANAGSR